MILCAAFFLLKSIVVIATRPRTAMAETGTMMERQAAAARRASASTVQPMESDTTVREGVKRGAADVADNQQQQSRPAPVPTTSVAAATIVETAAARHLVVSSTGDQLEPMCSAVLASMSTCVI